MEKVGELSHLTINLLKKFVACAIRDSFYRKFQFSCPPVLYKVKTLALLPHTLDIQCSWKDIPVDVLCSSMSIVRSELPSVLENPHIFFKGSESTGIGDRILDYRLHHNGHMPTRLKCLFSWNLNSWQSIESCDYKLRKIRRLLRSGPVCLQETKWHGSHSDMALQNLSGVCICSSDATISDNGEPMGGVAILLPPGTVLIKETELVKGRAIAALIQDRTISYYVISIYLRPGEKKQNVEQIIRAWSHVEKRSDHVFIAGDFNRIDTEYPELWTKLLDTFGCVDVDPNIVTYHFPGGQSKLDRVLVPEEYVTAAKLNPRLVTIPSHLVNGHEILKLKLMVKPSVISHPSHPKHLTIPSGVFIPGKDGTPVHSTAGLQELVRLLHREQYTVTDTECTFPQTNRHDWHNSQVKKDTATNKPDNEVPDFPGHMCEQLSPCPPPGGCSPLWEKDKRQFSSYLCAHLRISSCFWTWWRSQPPPKYHNDIRPYCRARKYLQSQAQWVNVPIEIVEDLILASKGAVISDTSSLTLTGGSVAISALHIHQMLEIIDTCYTGIPYVKTDEANEQARGLGNMVAFWERMRNICPKVNIYHGPIYQKDGQQCATDLDLDGAMLATRDFWFEKPLEQDGAWASVLDNYAHTQPWPVIPPPHTDTFLSTLLNTKDSAPGPDGIPYSAWRLLPDVSIDAVLGYFYDIVNDTALPPLQVGVWIPKAKSGPTADFFRPLGMPNTIDRLVDGAIASHVMAATSHLMHPSQAVMSCFKEPQKAVSAIQNILDSRNPACTLLADLSKAFERVNPHWILRLLRIRQAPRWLIAYTKFILFNRRVTHKVQGRLLPSKTIQQGVDMGRSFSVYLFCLAMDPLFVYLNRIPGVLSVQGYVDDTTIVGDAQNLHWISAVAQVYDDLATAGFVVDAHSCFRSCVTTKNRSSPVCCSRIFLEEQWPQLVGSEPHATITIALQKSIQPGYNVALLRIGIVDNEENRDGTFSNGSSIMCILSYEQGLAFLQGKDYGQLGVFANGKCNCKSKSHILTNFRMRPSAISTIDHAGFGLHSISGHAPSLGLALAGRWVFGHTGLYEEFELPILLPDIVPTPFKKLQERLKAFNRPTLSIVARCTGYNTFILSVLPYTMSYFGIDTVNLNKVRQAAVQFVLKRHWISAEIFPYMLRFMNIAPLLDPALTALVAALGLYLREGNPIEEIATQHGRGVRALLPLTPDPVESQACNGRQLSVVHDLIRMWSPFVSFNEIYGALTQPAKNTQARLAAVKKIIIDSMVLAAKGQLREKVIKEGWSKGISFHWVEVVSKLKKSWCNPLARFALLRWVVNQDDDVWLSMRGTRHQQQCGHCMKKGESFPHGFYRPPLCETCIHESGVTAWTLASTPSKFVSLLQAYTHPTEPNAMKMWCEKHDTLAIGECVCRACGEGDNTVGHWTRWCPIPLVVAHAILRPSLPLSTLNEIALMSPRHTAVCTIIVVNFRRLLRQEGAFLHQKSNDPRPISWWVQQLHAEVAQEAHYELGVSYPLARSGVTNCLLAADFVELQTVIPLDYPTMHLPSKVVIARSAFEAKKLVATLELGTQLVASLNALLHIPVGREANVEFSLVSCPCGSYHVQLRARTAILPGEVLIPASHGEPKLFVQFDGSAHRLQKIGGAGAALLQVSTRGVTLLKWASLAIPRCVDNIIAEGRGACLGISLYESYVTFCQQRNITPYALDKVQGDIKPLLQHLDFRSRFRRKDVVQLADLFHRKRSRVAPKAITEYRPREANAIADFLAGRASHHLRNLDVRSSTNGDEPFLIDCDPPYGLLFKEKATIQGKHQAGKTVLCLTEKLDPDFLLLAKCAAWKEGKYQRSLAEIALASEKCTVAYEVEYIAAAEDGEGRLYTQQNSAQNMPKDLRLLLFGDTHWEVDISGAHYELIRIGSGSPTLPNIHLLREWFCKDLVNAAGNLGHAEVLKDVKCFPILIINAGKQQAISVMQAKGYDIPRWVFHWADDLILARDALTSVVLPLLRPELQTSHRNKHYYTAESLESLFMLSLLREVQYRCFVPSVIWLHDGFWISNTVGREVLEAGIEHALRTMFPYCSEGKDLVRVRCLKEDKALLAQELVGVKPANILHVPRHRYRRKPTFTKEHPKVVFRDSRLLKRKAATYFDRVSKRFKRMFLQ